MAFTTPLDTFPTLLARAWRWGRRLVWGTAIAVAFVAALELAHVIELAARVHPALGWTVAGLVVLAASAVVGRSVWRYARAPRTIVPPDLPDPAAGWTPAQRRRYVRFAERFLRRQQTNPRVPPTTRDLVPAAIAAVHAAAEPPAGEEGPSDASALVATVETEVDRILEPLDREARRLIRRAAVDVAVVTGVTPSVLLDALITLARNLDLIARLADLYHGRPGLLGTVRVVRDVLGAAAAAGAAEIVSDHVTSTLAEMTGSWSARLLGPIGQATVNGVVTMRLGNAARLRCRSLRGSRVPWSPIDRAGFRKSARRLYAWIGDDLGPAAAATMSQWWIRLGSRDEPAGEGGDAGDPPRPGGGRFLERLRSRWRGTEGGDVGGLVEPESGGDVD